MSTRNVSAQLYREMGVATIKNYFYWAVVRESCKETGLLGWTFRGEQVFPWRVKPYPLQGPSAGERLNPARGRQATNPGKGRIYFWHLPRFGVCPPAGGAVAARPPAVAFPGAWARAAVAAERAPVARRAPLAPLPLPR